MTRPAFEYLPISVRAWPDSGGTRQARGPKPGHRYIPYRYLVFDTETTTDPSQRLNFGSAQVITIRFGDRFFDEPKIAEEIVFYADDLPGRYPEGYRTLVTYCAERRLKLVSRTEFVREYVTQSYKIKGRKITPLALACFNAPFDLSRIAVRHGLAQGDLKDGFAFYLKDDSTRTVAVKQLDSKKQLIKGADVLDLRTLVFAMTNKAPNLAGACKLFQIPEAKVKGHAEVHGLITPDYIDYNRQDVTATAWLTLEALKLFEQHPVRLSPLNALSPASLAKSYYEAMGILPLSGRNPSRPGDAGKRDVRLFRRPSRVSHQEHDRAGHSAGLHQHVPDCQRQPRTVEVGNRRVDRDLRSDRPGAGFPERRDAGRHAVPRDVASPDRIRARPTGRRCAADTGRLWPGRRRDQRRR